MAASGGGFGADMTPSQRARLLMASSAGGGRDSTANQKEIPQMTSPMVRDSSANQRANQLMALNDRESSANQGANQLMASEGRQSSANQRANQLMAPNDRESSANQRANLLMTSSTYDVLAEVQDRLSATKCNLLSNTTLSKIGHEDLIVELLGEQVSCPELTQDPKPVLQYYLYTCSFWGFPDLIRKIIDAGADVDFQNDRTKWTPLHAAVFQEHPKVIMALLAAGATPTIKDFRGRSPVDFASVSTRVWYIFEELGHRKTSRQQLVDLEVIREPGSTDRQLSNRTVRSANAEKTQRNYKPSWGNDSSRMKAVFGAAD